MSRIAVLSILVVGLASLSASRAQPDVAPAPREIRADGSRDPVPEPVAAKKENPLEVVDRIIKNSKSVGDKLAKTDVGSETRGTQNTILKDIQSLIDQQENPPPKPDDQPNKDKDKKPDDMQKKDDMMPKGGMNGMDPMKKDMPLGGGMDQQPMSNSESPRDRKPRQQQGEEPKQKEGQSKEPMTGKQQPMAGTPPKDPKNTGGAKPDPSMGDPKTAGRASLPFEDEIVKDVWGHLPDKLRQQAAQYYQQDFMPRYTDLLKLYYSSLTETGGKK